MLFTEENPPEREKRLEKRAKAGREKQYVLVCVSKT